jgi:transcriptional regulator with XRE-family HTH domain
VRDPGAVPTQNAALDLGRTARRLRESQNLTLADVARLADISSAMLSRLETGRVSPSLETIVALSQALGVTPSVLMQRVGTDEGGAQLIRAGEGLETVRSGTRRAWYRSPGMFAKLSMGRAGRIRLVEKTFF